MKNFILGILVTIVIEIGIFCYYTVSYNVEINRTYNPQIIVNMLEGKSN